MMRKRMICLMISLLVFFSTPLYAFADGEEYTADLSETTQTQQLSYVVDNADLLTPEQEQQLEEQLAEIRNRQQFDIVVLTENTLNGQSVMAYADDFYDYNGYGYGPNHDGCLLLLAMDTRDWWISTTGYGITALTDYGIQYVGDQFVDRLKSTDYDYYEAFSRYANVVDGLVTDAKSGNIYDTNNTKTKSTRNFSASHILICLVIALIIALIVAAGVRNSYKPVKFSRGAANYLVDGSMILTQSYDNFLYSNVTSHRIESDSSSGGGGGSSTHTSSSGTSHGGGGGKF